VSRSISPGIYVLALLFVAGIWLAASPFVMQTQPAGVAWTPSTINNVATGAVLIVVSLGGILIHLGLALRDLVSLASARAETEGQ
jgi:hypothetical protein